MKHIKKVIKIISRIALRPYWLSKVSCLAEVSRPLANALRDTIENNTSPEEKAWIDRIECLRDKLVSTEMSIAEYVAEKTDLADEDWDHAGEGSQTIGQVCQAASKPPLWSLLLFRLIREFKPTVCLELGTCLGISASYQAAALKLNQVGRIVTLEGSKPRASLAEQTFQALGLDNTRVVVGWFQDTLSGVLEQCEAIDYAFIDGHHDEKATLTYFEQILPFLQERAVLAFDDISWSTGMKRAWKIIEADKRVKVSLDLRQIGICIVNSATEEKQSFRIPMV